MSNPQVEVHKQCAITCHLQRKIITVTPVTPHTSLTLSRHKLVCRRESPQLIPITSASSNVPLYVRSLHYYRNYRFLFERD